MAIQTFVASTVLTAAQMNALQANDYNQTVSTKTASYTLVAADKGTKIVMNSASATTITVNTSLFAAGDTLTILNIAAGVCTVTAGTATVSTTGSLALAQNGGGTLYFTSAGVSVFQADGVTASGPTFNAFVATDQGITANTFTKITYGSENWDSASNFASSRFTPTTAGYYQINLQTRVTTAANADTVFCSLNKNGSQWLEGSRATGLSTQDVNTSSVMVFNGSTDYVEGYIFSTGTSTVKAGSEFNQLSGIFIRGL